MPVRAANAAPTTANEADIIPNFWEADVRRVEGIALWALTRESRDSASTGTGGRAHAMGEAYELPVGLYGSASSSCQTRRRVA
jgi:hypothetical protein